MKLKYGVVCYDIELSVFYVKKTIYYDFQILLAITVK